MPKKGREICENTHTQTPTHLAIHRYMEKGGFFFLKSHGWVLQMQLGSLIVYEEGSKVQYKNLVMDYKKKRIKHSL